MLGLFLALSWAGLWLVLPPLGRAAALFGFLLLSTAVAVPFLRFRRPTVADSLARLDRGSGLAHRPATAVTDRLATTQGDRVSEALWQAHLERARQAVQGLKAGWPAPRMVTHDPFAIRGLVLLLLVATFVAAGGERIRRIAAAFDWVGGGPVANFRVDAWVTPPPYTARPPVILAGLRAGEPVQPAPALTVPAGSVLVIRASGAADLEVSTTGGLAVADPDPKAPPPSGAQEHRFAIQQSGAASVRTSGDDVTWKFEALPDRAPTIALTKDPEGQARGSLLLAYRLEDDYGVIGARASFVRKPNKNQTAGHALYGPPEFALLLPQARTRSGVAQTTKDLTDHPWAGAEF